MFFSDPGRVHACGSTTAVYPKVIGALLGSILPQSPLWQSVATHALTLINPGLGFRLVPQKYSVCSPNLPHKFQPTPTPEPSVHPHPLFPLMSIREKTTLS